MERTKKPLESSMPDAINCSTDKKYTNVPNQLIKNPDISGTAKALMSLLLSNSVGWKSHMEIIKTMMKEKEYALKAGVRELEEAGYLRRIRYRMQSTKVFVGTIWLYSDEPGVFNSSKYECVLRKNGYELDDEKEPTTRKATTGKPSCGFFKEEKQKEENEEKEEKESTKEKEVKEEEKEKIKEEKKENKTKEKFTPPTIEEVRQYCLERKNNVDPEMWFNFYESKGWMIGKNKMKNWKAAVITWERHEINSFTPLRTGNRKPVKKYIDDYGDRYYFDDKTGNYYNKEGVLYR